MLTLNQIIKDLKGWFESHAQINTATAESDFDFNAERNLVYPVSNIEHLDSDIADKQFNHQFRITIADLVNPNIGGHANEIVSDSILIAEDFFAYCQEKENWIFKRASSLNRFEDDTADRTAGIVFTITLSTIRPQNTCQKPTR